MTFFEFSKCIADCSEFQREQGWLRPNLGFVPPSAVLYSRAQLVTLINAMQSLPDCNAGIFCQNSTDISYEDFLSNIHKLQQVIMYFPWMNSFETLGKYLPLRLHTFSYHIPSPYSHCSLQNHANPSKLYFYMSHYQYFNWRLVSWN